jgi:hypothetical protein
VAVGDARLPLIPSTSLDRKEKTEPFRRTSVASWTTPSAGTAASSVTSHPVSTSGTGPIPRERRNGVATDGDRLAGGRSRMRTRSGATGEPAI